MVAFDAFPLQANNNNTAQSIVIFIDPYITVERV
jgi:hypothetical protein